MARTVKCPSCGAELTVKDDSRDFMFCEFCGTKVRLDDYRETHRYVDEAEVEKVKAAKEIELKKLEFEERKRREEDAGSTKFLIGTGIFIGVMLLFMVFVGKNF